MRGNVALRWRRALFALLVVTLAFVLVPGRAQAEMEEEPICEVPVAAQADSVLAPRARADSSMKSGQVATWDCVWFGSYPQAEVAETDALKNAVWENGDATVDGVRYRRISWDDVFSLEYWKDDVGEYRYFRYEPVKWRVLEVSGTTALVVADSALDGRPYNENYGNVTWATSSIRSWLNGYAASANKMGKDYTSNSFIEKAFSADEREAVRQSALTNADGKRSGIDGGPDTSDRVFLLSEDDVWGDKATAHGFVSAPDTYDEGRRCKPTDFARVMGGYISIDGDDVGCCEWWLRAPGSYADHANYVIFDGRVHPIGIGADRRGTAIRPALKLNQSSPLVHPAGTVSSDGSSVPVPVPTPAKTFPDVPASAWYAGVVGRAAGLGLINGYKNGRFGPADNVTRGQVAVILWNMAGKPSPKGTPKDFPDVAAGKYYYDAVRWASSAGVVSGYKSGEFGPDDLVTREQLAAMLANYAGKVAGRDTSGSAADFSGMKDAAKVSGWAASSVGWCFRNKIISGTKDGRVNPQGNATRAETAKMVVFLHDLL